MKRLIRILLFICFPAFAFSQTPRGFEISPVLRAKTINVTNGFNVYRSGGYHPVKDIDTLQQMSLTWAGNHAFSATVQLNGGAQIGAGTYIYYRSGSFGVQVGALGSTNTRTQTLQDKDGVIALTSDIAAAARIPVVMSGNLSAVLSGDYLNATSTQHVLTLPATAGFATDGNKLVTALVTGANGLKVSVPVGYTLIGPSGAATPSTGGVVIPQFGKCQFIPIGVNSYIYEPIGLSVTVL